MKLRQDNWNRGLIWLWLLQLLGGATLRLAVGTEIDESKLPPAATLPIEFARDIKPILDTSCIRCHGPEKPKSGFRLDNRAAALKGGENGVDILPGNSAKSPLIHYVAQLVPDLEMPPEGKGEPLTTNQIGLLRAWIDQGVPWDNATPTNLFDFSISPGAGWRFVSGDERKFREQTGRREGLDAGLESFDVFQQSDPETKVSVTGHALMNDYQTVLKIDRNQVGFIHSGWQQYRRYYDDTGGYFPASVNQTPLSLDSDLHLDIGKAWVDFGLTLPHWPNLVFGYEYDYRRGQEATTSWGAGGPPGNVFNVAPASKGIDEGTHVFKFDFDAELKGITIEDRFRGELYHLNTYYTNLAGRNAVTQDVKDQNRYFQGANSLRLERKFKDWLFCSGGYFYSLLNADDLFTNFVTAGPRSALVAVPRLDLERESHIFNLNGLLGPFYGLALSLGAQSEWTRQQGIGSGDLTAIAFTRQPGIGLTVSPAVLASDYQQNTVTETVGLRYTKIPFTSLFADARLRQETISQSDSDLQRTGSFIENPSFTSHMTDFRVGFNTSPWQRVSLSAHYRRYEDSSRYRTNQVPQPLGGYPGFISWRDLVTDEFEAKLVVRPSTWLKTTFSYQILSTEYSEDTRAAFDILPPAFYSPGGNLVAGNDDSHVYNLGLTLIPYRRLYISTTLSYQDTKLTTFTADAIPPYEGDVLSVIVSGTYVLSLRTDLLVSYSSSLADYEQSAQPAKPNTPPPIGIKYQQHALQAGLAHRLTRNLTTRLQYGYFYYHEPTAADVNNYRAHTLFASLTYRF